MTAVEQAASELRNATNLRLSEVPGLTSNFKQIRHLQDVWIGNVNHSLEQAESAAMNAIAAIQSDI